MTSDTIDHGTLSRLVETGAVKDARVVGMRGGWKIVVDAGTDHAYTLTAQRRGETRLFRKMDTLIGYLAGLGISQFAVDAKAFFPEVQARPDRSAAMKGTHEAAAHDRWVAQQIEERIRQADSPDTAWILHEDARTRWATRRAEILAAHGDDA